MRGSLPPTPQRAAVAGIIPAGAGLTLTINDKKVNIGDHPRGCGAHFVISHGVVCDMGSSPRVRGSPDYLLKGSDPDGIIPAGAGLTLQQVCRERLRRDHPRGCGAHWIPSKASGTTLGSSPRVRGSRSACVLLPLFFGIIPAGAGLTE